MSCVHVRIAQLVVILYLWHGSNVAIARCSISGPPAGNNIILQQYTATKGT